MSKNMNTYLNEAVEEGIITNKQRLELKLKLGRDKVDSGRRMSRVSDLVLTLIFIIIVMSSIIMIIDNNPNANAFVSIFISVVFVISSILMCYDAIRKNNYFVKEIAIMTNALSNVMFISSINLIIKYDYYFPDNVYIGFIITLPLLFVIDTYISKFIVILGFCIIRTPYINLSFSPLYNTTIVSVITILLMIGTIYKLSVFLADSNKNPDENRFFSFKVRITVQEILLYMLLMKINGIIFGTQNIYIIYSIYTILLIRRSSIFKKAVQMPVIVDSLFFIYTVFFFVRFDVHVKHETDILICHIIYYIIYFTLAMNNKLSNVDMFYKIQQHFYINIFLLTYIIFNLQDVHTQKYVFILSVIVGIFNVYQGKVEMKFDYVVLGLFIVILAILLTGSVAYGVATIVIVICSLLFMLHKLGDKVIDEVSRNNEK